MDHDDGKHSQIGGQIDQQIEKHGRALGRGFQ